ncbi:hypothetical protein KKA14_18115, partial [bacterium]|nr:hypothetical protein [bacterium]
MNTISKEFTLSQLELLSILDAFGEPVSIDILGALLPLSPNQLFDQIAYCGKAGVIEHKEDRTVSLVFNISEAIRTKLKDINSVSRLSDLYHQLDRMNLLERLETTSLIRLLSGARED